MKKIAVIGGGASGLAAALSAAQEAAFHEADLDVVVFEAADRIGKSILASGNGRCNFSNSSVVAEDYYHADFVRKSFAALPAVDVLSFFQDAGLLWRTESEGRLYPLTNKASSVLDVLRFALQDREVGVECRRKVLAVVPVKSQFMLSFEDERTAFFDAVIVACGGNIARSLLPTRYYYYNTEPLLGPLTTNTEPIRGLNNIRARCRLTCGDTSQEGEVQFRDYGISGIVTFDLSRFVRSGDKISIDFFPSFTKEEILGMLKERFVRLQGRIAIEFCAGMLQRPLALAVLRAAGIKAEEEMRETSISALAHAIKEFSLEVNGIEDYRQCQVRRGGFDVESFNPSTLESLTDPGLFLVGEALDIDGPCGGYNLHWAWTSGILAGRNAAL